MTDRSSRSFPAALSMCAVLLASPPSLAREPGIGPALPPGLTIGVPIAASPPPGLYLMNRTSYAASSLVDAAGSPLGLDTDVISESLQVLWMTDVRVFGARYKAFAVLPFIHLAIDRSSPATGAPGEYTGTGFANPHIVPFDLSGPLGGGLHLSSGLGFYPRLSSYDRADPVPVGADFWTVDSSTALTFLRDGWHATAHVVYEINTRSVATDYTSGHNLILNLTATKELGVVALGPAGYVVLQTTDDRNDGTAYGGQVVDPQRLIAAGALASVRLGPLTAALVYTHDVFARSAIEGDKLSLNLSLRAF